MNRRAFASFLVSLPLVGFGCVTRTAGSSDDAMTVACDFDHMPFIGEDAAGKPIGRDVEMMQAIADEMKVRLVWVKMPFPQILDAVASGKVDAACATIGITKARSERVLFTKPYFETRIAALVRVGPGEPVWLADLHGRKVAASRGTTSESALADRDLGAIPIVDNVSKHKADERLLGHEVDACITDGADADEFAMKSGGRLAVLAEPVALELYGIAVGKDKDALRARLDAALSALTARGAFAPLDKKFGLSK